MSEALAALERVVDDGDIEIASPAVGVWRQPPRVGALLAAGDSLGYLEILGVLVPLTTARGGMVKAIVARGAGARSRGEGAALGYRDPLLLLSQESLGEGVAAAGDPHHAADAAAGLWFRSPSSGRFYGRPAPDKSPFVSAGDEVARGTTVCLLEVMKTFNRVVYGGDALPARARIVRVVPADGDDVQAGDPLFELEPMAGAS